MEFSCGQHTYSAGKLDARAQFHVVRRLTPFLKGVIPILAKLQGSGNLKQTLSDMKDPSKAAESAAEVLPQLADIIAGMDDETADYVIFTLLSVVKRKQENGLGWAPVTAGNSMMFVDIGMAEMLTLAGRSLVANLGSFFDVLNSAFNRQE